MTSRATAAADNRYAQTPVELVHYVVRAYQERQLNPAAALHEAGIQSAQLHDIDNHVDAAQFERLCSVAMQELDDEALGWFSRRLPWGSYGMLTRASISAATLGLAMARWCRHHNLLTDDIALALHVDNGRARIQIDERSLRPEFREFALLTLLRNLHGLSCWFVDSRIGLHSAQFPFAAPRHHSLFDRLFPGPVHFDAPQAALEYDASYLQLPLQRDGAAADRMLQRALPILIWPYRRDRLLSLRVRRLLDEPHTTHTTETLAARLYVSPRTLYRELRREGTSLQQLKDRARRERAEELLLRSNLSIKQIASHVGFASQKSFIRAFGKWTMQTPQAWRDQRRAASSQSLRTPCSQASQRLRRR